MPDNSVPHSSADKPQLSYFPPLAGEDVYATFGCQTWRKHCADWASGLVDTNESLDEACGNGFVHFLPDFGDELVPCLVCGGPSELLEVFTPVAG